MKIGIWVNEPIDQTSGGSFTYLTSLISAIDQFDFNSVDVVFISPSHLQVFSKPCINIAKFQKKASFLIRCVRKGLKILSADVFKRQINFIDQKEKKQNDALLAKHLKQQGIKALFYPLPSSAVIEGIPYILNNWDLAHYTTYAFPEMVDDDGFARRNSWYEKVLPSALLIFAETEAGKQELCHHLNIIPEKIRVLPMFSSGKLAAAPITAPDEQTILNKLGAKNKEFFFYPAQFWAHKNHYNLIKAFAQLVKKHPHLKLFLCGSDKGNIAYLKNVVNELNMQQNIIFTNFVDNTTLYVLYKNARALIMPTLLGPSNIPPIEALLLQCPVLCSDLKGHKEILGDTGCYFNALDDTAILNSMETLLDDNFRNEIIIKQQALAKTTAHTVENAVQKLNNYFIEVAAIRNCWP